MYVWNIKDKDVKQIQTDEWHYSLLWVTALSTIFVPRGNI